MLYLTRLRSGSAAQRLLYLRGLHAWPSLYLDTMDLRRRVTPTFLEVTIWCSVQGRLRGLVCLDRSPRSMKFDPQLYVQRPAETPHDSKLGSMASSPLANWVRTRRSVGQPTPFTLRRASPRPRWIVLGPTHITTASHVSSLPLSSCPGRRNRLLTV